MPTLAVSCGSKTQKIAPLPQNPHDQNLIQSLIHPSPRRWFCWQHPRLQPEPAEQQQLLKYRHAVPAAGSFINSAFNTPTFFLRR